MTYFGLSMISRTQYLDPIRGNDHVLYRHPDQMLLALIEVISDTLREKKTLFSPHR